MGLRERIVGAKETLLGQPEERKIKRVIDSCHSTASKIMAGHDVITSSKYVSKLVFPALAEADFKRRFCSDSNPIQGKKKLPESIFEKIKLLLLERKRLSVVRVSHDPNVVSRDVNYSLIANIQNEITEKAPYIISAYYGKKNGQFYAEDDFEEHIRSLSFVQSRIKEALNSRGDYPFTA